MTFELRLEWPSKKNMVNAGEKCSPDQERPNVREKKQNPEK